MPHSLKARLGNLRYKKIISDKDYDRLCKALEQEPCKDAISRQAVNILVDELARAISDERCCISRGRSTATIMQDILDLPSVKPQEPKWISVEERLPEKDGRYWVWAEFYCTPDHVDDPNTYELDTDVFYIGGKWYGFNVKRVIAWMPLELSFRNMDKESENERKTESQEVQETN